MKKHFNARGLAILAALDAVSKAHGATQAQVALAWVLRQAGVMAVPKASRAVHLRQNWAARELRLGESDLAQLGRLFPPPRSKRALAVR